MGSERWEEGAQVKCWLCGQDVGDVYVEFQIRRYTVNLDVSRLFRKVKQKMSMLNL